MAKPIVAIVGRPNVIIRPMKIGQIITVICEIPGFY